jgi:hypothetical protein
MTARFSYSSKKCRLDTRKFPRWFKSPVQAARSSLDKQLEMDNRPLEEVLVDR